MNTHNLAVEAYHGIEASVNAYIFYDDESMILVDCLRNSREARLLAAHLKTFDQPLLKILITHGHADHYMGMGVMKQEFPDVKIVVTRHEIKDDIIAFSKWMDTAGWLDKEPFMKLRDDLHPDGFDYDKNIEVLDMDRLELRQGGVLELSNNYQPAECAHLTTIYSEDLNAFFTGDFCYHKVHIWLAVEQSSLDYWKSQLDKFRSALETRSPLIFPGHGQQTDLSLFHQVKSYIEDFENTIRTAKSREEAMLKMEKLYPDYAQKDFLLLNSVNAKLPG